MISPVQLPHTSPGPWHLVMLTLMDANYRVIGASWPSQRSEKHLRQAHANGLLMAAAPVIHHQARHCSGSIMALGSQLAEVANSMTLELPAVSFQQRLHEIAGALMMQAQLLDSVCQTAELDEKRRAV